MVYTVPGRPPNHQIDEQIASRPINNSERIQCISPGESFVETNYYTPQPAKPRIKISTLVSTCVVLPGNEIFIDRNLPELELPFTRNDHFPPEYFVELHNSVIAGSYLNFDKSNFMGARIPLSHCKLNIQNWRRYLVGYDQPEILQHLEFGFPLGLREIPPPELKCASRIMPQLISTLFFYIFIRCNKLNFFMTSNKYTGIVPKQNEINHF